MYGIRATLPTLALTLLLGSLCPASAQLTLKGGVNLATFFGDDAEGAESVRGLNLGGSFGLAALGPIQLLGEVYYREKGARGGFAGFQDAAATGETVEVGLDYVEIPVLARLDLGDGGGRVTPYIQAGPAFGWQLDCGVEVRASGGSETACDDLTQDFRDTLNDYEMGGVVGAGLDISVLGGMGALTLDARYTQGLSRIGQSSEGLDIRNRALTLMLGYSFAAGGRPGAFGGGPPG